jgi:PTS system mannose-specific IIA component
MVGILIVTHGNLGLELLKSAELIIGKQTNTYSLGIFHGDSIEEFNKEVMKYIKILDGGKGVLVFTDLYGGSPSNVIALSQREIQSTKFECVTGVNLPMILEALTIRDSIELSLLKEHCMEIGHQGIKDLLYQINLTTE